jgi:hypothetical protein
MICPTHLDLILFDLYTPFSKLCCKNATCLLVEAVHAPANTTALAASNLIFQANSNAIDNNGGKLHSKALAQEILLITHGQPIFERAGYPCRGG